MRSVCTLTCTCPLGRFQERKAAWGPLQFEATRAKSRSSLSDAKAKALSREGWLCEDWAGGGVRLGGVGRAAISFVSQEMPQKDLVFGGPTL